MDGSATGGASLSRTAPTFSLPRSSSFARIFDATPRACAQNSLAAPCTLSCNVRVALRIWAGIPVVTSQCVTHSWVPQSRHCFREQRLVDPCTQHAGNGRYCTRVQAAKRDNWRHHANDQGDKGFVSFHQVPLACVKMYCSPNCKLFWWALLMNPRWNFVSFIILFSFKNLRRGTT